jgi:hypothetical protein
MRLVIITRNSVYLATSDNDNDCKIVGRASFDSPFVPTNIDYSGGKVIGGVPVVGNRMVFSHPALGLVKTSTILNIIAVLD